MCLSGIDAIALADQLIRAGEFDVVVAGGQESMTAAPHLLMGSRAGYKYGDVTVLDHMAYDGLHDVFTDQPMGALTEQRNDVDQFTRAEQDEYAAGSHQKAAAGWKDGVFADEVVPVMIPQRQRRSDRVRRGRGHPREHHSGVARRAQAGVPPGRHHHRRFGVQNFHTAAAVVVMKRRKAEELGLSSGLVEIGPTVWWPGPVRRCRRASATRSKAIAREGVSDDQLDVIEINEAFSSWLSPLPGSFASTRKRST